MAYFMSGFKQLIKNKSYTFQLDIDGKTKEINSTTLLIGLTNSIGGFERILPEARVDDGLLHLIYLKDSNLLETVKDRKSTRLNSSHANISYAVFCLKKKKNNINLLTMYVHYRN